MEHRNWRWVSRDTGDKRVDVWIGNEEPKVYRESDTVIFDCQTATIGEAFVSIPAKQFLALTGIDIQPGQCVKVEFTAKVLEE